MTDQQTLNQYALKYRPRIWDEVKGQDGIAKEMSKRSRLDQWPTVSLLQGPTGSGKTTVSFIAAAAMQCDHKDEDGNPCGECATCRDIFNENFDRGCTHMLDGASAGKDDVIDLMRKATHSKPLYGRKHVFIIEEIDQMSPAAKKTLLKILEKPSPWIHFILLSMTGADGNKVPVSIADRALTYHFRSLKERDVAYAVKHVLEKEGVWDTLPADFKKEGFFTIVNSAGGSLRRALKIMNRAIFAEFFTTQEIEDNFQFISESSALKTLEALIKGDTTTFVRDVEEMRSKITITEWVNLVNYFILKYEEDRLLGDASDHSPSTALLRKAGDNTALRLAMAFTNLIDDFRKGFSTPSLGARKLLNVYANLHPNAVSIPTR